MDFSNQFPVRQKLRVASELVASPVGYSGSVYGGIRAESVAQWEESPADQVVARGAETAGVPAAARRPETLVVVTGASFAFAVPGSPC